MNTGKLIFKKEAVNLRTDQILTTNSSSTLLLWPHFDKWWARKFNHLQTGAFFICSQLNDTVSTSEYILTNELLWMWKKAAAIQTDACRSYPGMCTKGLETYDIPQLWTDSPSNEIWTRDLPNMHDCYPADPAVWWQWPDHRQGQNSFFSTKSRPVLHTTCD